ncbi:MAG: hypothetical protein ACOYM0_08010 [Bacteroidales bacterium]
MEDEIIAPESAPGQTPLARPNLLTVLCILTFINGLLTFISSIFVGAFFDQFVSIATEFAEKFKLPGLEMITEGRPLFFYVNAVLYGISVAGAFLMWSLKKNGFHVYAIAQILLILSPMYFFQLPGPSIFDIILSGTFVLLYSTNLKIMK